MSKIGSQLVNIPLGTTVTVGEEKIVVKGPKGEVNFKRFKRLKVTVAKTTVSVERTGEDKQLCAKHGLMRMLIQNAVSGVNEPWKKTLEVHGVGFRVEKQGENLQLKLGFSHPIIFTPPQEVKLEVKGNKITAFGVDKQKVGEVAAQIKKIKPPDKYKGKGIRYEGEVIKLKPGKKAKAGA